MPDQPRRVLEKSRTVRRRYQRSNKRFQFTASQLERIERDEERERKAQKLREKEKKRIANRKKKAEKEAREREERKRLGLPDPSAPKLPASQPLLLNFFGKKEERQQATTDSTESQEDTEVETEVEEDWFDGDLDEEDIRCEGQAPNGSAGSCTSRDRNETVSAVIAHGQGAPQQALDRATILTECEENVNQNETKRDSRDPLATAHDSTSGILHSLGESFQDETAILLEDLDPDSLQLSGQSPRNRHPETDASCVLQSQSRPSLTSHSCEPPSGPGGSSARHFPKKGWSEISPDVASQNQDSKMSLEQAGSKCPEPVIEIYEDPEDIIAQISTQDLMEVVDDEKDDYKENWHPNVPYGPQQRQQPDVTQRCRPKPYNELQASAEREPLMPISQALDTPADEASKKKSPCSTRRCSSPSPAVRKSLVAEDAGTSTPRCASTKDDPVSIEDEEDEFGEFDLTMEELETLCS
jgi:hypothetical protein